VGDTAVDFFVSYTSADRPWAEWIAWELEAAGYSTVLQAWDMVSGSNFVLEMDVATSARRTIAVLSPAFMASAFCRAEWAAAFREDPDASERRLVPVRVRECQPRGLLGSLVYTDVVGLSEVASREALLLAAVGGRVKPAAAPRFPGSAARGDAVGEPVRRPAGEGAAIFRVPVATRTFSGRTRVLKQLADGLRGDGRVAVVAVNGIGGVGKTQLAAYFARSRREDYDVVWWVRAEQPSTLRSDLTALAAKLALPEAAEADEQATISAVREWLARNPRWLVIFDNAPGPDAISDELVDASDGHVLITSRAHGDWRRIGARPLGLDVWQRHESRTFLHARTGERDRATLDAIADALGDLPLALEQAAAYTTTLAITLSGYRERLRDRAPELFEAGRPAGYEHTVATVWQLAFDEIAGNAKASELLGVCAQLAPEQIPRDVLHAAGGHTTPTITAGRDLDDAIGLLLAYALLTPGSQDTLAMHRLVAQLTRDHAPDTSRARWQAAAIRALDELWPQRPREHEHWPDCQRLLAHATTATHDSQPDSPAPAATAALLGRVAQYQHVRAQFTVACDLTQRALAIEEAVYGPEHPEVAITLTNLGIVQLELGKLEAARVTLQRALAIREGVYGREHPEVAITLGNLGIVQQQLGEFEAARVSQQRALTIKEAVYGPEHPEVAITLTNLGRVQRQLGEFEVARASLQRALAIKEGVYGREHPDVAITLTNLGDVQRQLGELEAARACITRAAGIFERRLGPDHPHTRQARAILESLAG